MTCQEFFNALLFGLSGGWAGTHNFSWHPNFLMAGAANRGRALLDSPVAFQPKGDRAFPFHICFASAATGFLTASIIFIAWLFSLEFFEW